jgi:CubicO group peptidase (beta-lactamase class C family)
MSGANHNITSFRSLSFLLISLLFVFSCGRKSESPKHHSITTSLDSLFKTVPDFSGVLLIADKGKPVYHKAFGYKNFLTQEPLDTTSVFELASVSKQFTSMIIMMLKKEGKLDYDEPIEKYISGLPYRGITIRHLLSHTSGLPDYQAIMDQHWDKHKIAGNNDNITYLIKYHPERLFPPGERFEYSNTGYMLLASIAEKASGRDFIELCREWIFRRIGMEMTDIRTKEQKRGLSQTAWGHIYVEEKQKYVPADSFPAFNYAIWLGNRKGPGRVSATSSDLLKWDRALYSETLVEKQFLNDAFSPATLNNGSLSQYGFGWYLSQDPKEGKIVYHTGDNPGYRTIIIRFVDINKTVIFLSNNAHKKYDELLKGVQNILFPE